MASPRAHFLRGEQAFQARGEGGSIGWVMREGGGSPWMGGSEGTAGAWRGHSRDSTEHGVPVMSRSPVRASGQGSRPRWQEGEQCLPARLRAVCLQSLDRGAFCVSFRVFVDSLPRAELRPRHRGSYSEELGCSQSRK